MAKNKNQKKHTLFYVTVGCLLLFTVTYKYFIDWATAKFDVTLKQVIYTVFSPMKGADSDFLAGAVNSCLPAILVAITLWIVYALIDNRISKTFSFVCCIELRKKQFSLNLFKVFRIIIVLLLIASLTITTTKAEKAFEIKDYISSYIRQTTIYEDYYVAPNTHNVKSPENPKNLIHIYLESMETTYASESEGGKQPKNNYIPNLTNLAKENISFSNSENLGGFRPLSGASWTMGALLSTTAGVPFSFPIDGNSMGDRTNFAKGLTTMGDILNENGYAQEFLCGSDGDFAGRKDYFVQHGNYNVFDLYSAREKKYIPEDYCVWWGYEDAYLYEIAKKELTELYENNSQPFNFTMLTVDTHHIDGYVCDLCPDTYENQLENIILCADSQIYNFIEWCKEQPFYENTVIVITGDHPRMDTSLVDGFEYFDRTLYNCFINTDKSADELCLTNREFTSMDIFPTILSALNFKIEGNRLGLGTDMFSGEETLAEKMGFEKLSDELDKYSKYYIDTFS